MKTLNLPQLLLTLLIGFSGAIVAWWLEMPAAPLIGSTLAVTLGTIFGLNLHIPNWLRSLAFSVIGITLGAGITPHFFSDVGRWPLSLLVLFISVVTIMWLSQVILNRLFSFNRETVALSSSPGLLSYVVATASEPGSKADITVITFLQSYRVLLTTLLLPLIIASVGGDFHPAGQNIVITMSYLASLLVIVGTLLLGKIATKFALPSAFLLMGLALNGVLNFSEVVTGGLPPLLSFIGFSITGSLIGTRFKQCRWSDVRALIGVATVMTLIALSTSALYAAAVAQVLSMPFGQVWVAFAPGGVEAMASIALSMDYDSIYVATHHVLRIFILIGLLALWTRQKKSRDPAE